MTITNDIRKKFIDYFIKQGHTHVPSSSLVPLNDPTLMFTNSGMVQFKNYLTGKEKPPFLRATTYQKSVRAGGKHNDLDNVGYTLRHQTFFEMLGNFSFGDYFKDEAIFFAWDFLTKDLGLSKEKLYVTIFHTDDQAHDIWKKVANFSEDHIIRIATQDNFWQMGDTGPCGPCSEIFYDHGEKYPGGLPGTPEEDGDRYIEIWNLVFDQFEDLADGSRINMPKPCIDTGSGLERLSAILHGTNDTFEIDIMRGLIENIAHITNTDPKGPHKVSLRVIADHLRSSSFLIADGVFPSNEGRGYVLRRIMRRAMRHIHLIGYKDLLMYQLVGNLKELMGEVYPEIERAQPIIEETLKLEEYRFKQMLDKGLKLLNTEIEHVSENQILPGDIAFKLYDTYGFPLDLTQDALRAKNITVDTDAFNHAMEKQREEARKAWVGSGDTATESIWFSILEKVEPTDFLGYASTESEAQIVALVKNGEIVHSLKEGEKGYIITNQTPFFGETGGQVGDTGIIRSDTGLFEVTDTQKKLNRLFIHEGIVKEGILSQKEPVFMQVDKKRRQRIQGHHSATHLLQAVLQETLGKHVAQKGSFVCSDYLRFDFSHPRQMTQKEIELVEEKVNELILMNLSGTTRLMTPEEAIKEGAMALFGEKYGEIVRVVSFGSVEHPISIELCGGTHVLRTGDIGLFKIISEGAVSSGIRRIEAVTGMAAYEYMKQTSHILTQLSEILKTTTNKIPYRIETLLEDKKKLEKQISDMRQKAAIVASSEGIAEKQTINGFAYTFIEKTFQDVPAKELKGMADQFKKAIKTGVIVLISTNEGKVSIVIGVTNDLTTKINAIHLVKIGAAAVGGQGGGGRPDMAQAGGNQPDKIHDAIRAIKQALTN